MRAKPYVTGNTQVCVKQLTLAYERSAETKRLPLRTQGELSASAD